MGLPYFRFTLQHQQLGTKEIVEPDGWEDAVLKLERHPEFHSLVEYFDGAKEFTFDGNNGFEDGGIDFIKNVENQYGVDAELRIFIDISMDGENYENCFTGLLDMSTIQESGEFNELSCSIIREDFWAKLISRKETPVDIRSTTDLDGNAKAVIDLVDINLTCQPIIKKYEGHNEDDVTTSYTIPDNQYGGIDFANEVLSEINEKYFVARVEHTDRPFELFACEFAGLHIFDIQIFTVSGSVVLSSKTDANLEVRLQINDSTPITLTKTNLGNDGLDGRTKHTYNGVQNLRKNDLIRLYFYNNNAAGASYTFSWPANFFYDSYLKVTANTIYPSSSCQSYLLHDAFQSVINRITSAGFYSEILGSTFTNGRTYSADGCFCDFTLTTGLGIRGYQFTEKIFSTSLDKLWKGANPIFNLGLGYDVVNGSQVIRIEEKAFFYDRSSTSVNFDNVLDIVRNYDNTRVFKKIEIGFNKWQSEDISGIDDPQTKRTFATRMQKVGTDLILYSDFVAASLAIEVTRRQIIEKSKDWKFDNDTFIIAINSTPVSPDRYTPELDENFDSLSNLLNSDNRYNLTLTPLRNLLRWADYWNGCLQKYQSSSLKFVSGEGNYDMISDYSCTNGQECIGIICDSLSEKGDIPLGLNPGNYGSVFGFLHLPELYTIKIDMSWDDYVAIRSNRNKAIGISQTTTGHKKFFIKELDYEVCNSSATIKAWSAEQFTMEVV